MCLNSAEGVHPVSGHLRRNDCFSTRDLPKLSVYQIQQWPEISKLWAELDEVSPYSSFYLSTEWTTAWLEVFGQLLRPEILVFEHESNPVAICLLVRSTERRGPFRIKRIYLNTVGGEIADRTLMEFNNLLCRVGWEEKTSAALAAYLQSLEWDEFAVEGIPPGPILNCFLNSSFSALPPIISTLPSYYVDLGQLRQSKTSYESSLSSNTREQLRRSLKRYAKLGEISVEAAAEQPRAEELFEEMCGLHQSRWQKKGEEGAFGPGRRLDFHRTLIRKAFAKGSIQLMRVTAGQQTIGILYNFVKNGKVYFFQSGFNYSGEDKHLKPGLVTHTFAIRYCLNAGFTDYDFLAGDAQYKRSLAKDCRQLDWVVFARPRVKLSVIERLRSVKRRLRSLMRNA
jgi:CelD/BcsL family acetyltransferase involved in cellulose biosynthesis